METLGETKCGEEIEVDMVESTNSNNVKSYGEEDPDATEYSSSFADSTSDIDRCSGSSEGEVEMHMFDENGYASSFQGFGSSLQMRMESITETESVEGPTLSQTKRKKTEVWNHFTKIESSDNNNHRAKCNHCSQSYACHASKNGTSILKRHILTCNKLLASNDRKQKTLSYQNMRGGMDATCFSLATCRELLAKMIIVDGLPLKFVEGEGFRTYSQYVQPKFSIPSRTTIIRDILSIYEKEKIKLKDYFRKTSQRICLTTDTWTSVQNLSYMVLTAHYIDSDWILCKRIINFCLISNHEGETIGREVERCLFEWGIENVLTITVDNVSSNDVAISYLIKTIKNWNDLVLNGEHMHVRCFAHILNLIVCDGLKDHQKSIARVRRIVKYVQSSPARLQQFRNCVENVNIICKSNVRLDVPTRWNSTYLMLESAEKYERAFAKLIEIDSHYFLDSCGESERPPTIEDWANIRELIKFLKIFYDTTVVVSASSHVTSNIYISEVCNLKMVIHEYSECDNALTRRMAIDMQRKFDKYWGSCDKINLLMYVAIVLDPRCKMKFLKYCLTMLFDDEKANDLVRQVEIVIERLYVQYKSDLGFEISKDNSSIMVGTTAAVMRQSSSLTHNKVYEMFCNRHNKHDVSNNKTEVHHYLSEGLERFSDKSDILAWWKTNSLKFPLLSKMARDVIAIPISTVASESAFSSGDRVLDSFRNSLSSKTVEALICTQSWIRTSKHQSINVNYSVDDIDKIEQDFTSTNGDGDSVPILVE